MDGPWSSKPQRSAVVGSEVRGHWEWAGGYQTERFLSHSLFASSRHQENHSFLSNWQNVTSIRKLTSAYLYEGIALQALQRMVNIGIWQYRQLMRKNTRRSQLPNVSQKSLHGNAYMTGINYGFSASMHRDHD
ncbi:hypothetical protein VTL71DRAFT_4583 [Oculimacula yallundae]|uniref:Uncharacterized protein n=1 Tax=Oculimacula yallundae TaxID=86028 RepID=A0ABR4C2F9_9HELO